MTKKGKKKDAKKQKKEKGITEDDLDRVIKAAEAVLNATSKVPAEVRVVLEEILKHVKEIHSQYTAIRGFCDQQLKVSQDLEGAFTSVMAGINEIKAILNGGQPAAKADSGGKLGSIDDLKLEDRLKKKLHMSTREGKRIIKADWIGNKEDWRTINKLVKQFGFYWKSEGKQSRWEEQ